MTEQGLCATCRWMRLVTTRQGSTFILCRKSESDPSFPRYPVLPVMQCAGYEKRLPEESLDLLAE